MPKSQFYLMTLMNERVKKPARPWAGQQDQSPDHTAWCHAEVPQLAQVAETTLMMHPARVGTPWASPRLHQSQQKPASA